MTLKESCITITASVVLAAGAETDAPNTPQTTYDRYVDARDNAERISGGNKALPTNDRVNMISAYEIFTGDLLGPDTIVGEVRMTADFGNGTVDGTLHNNYIDMDGAASTLTGDVNFSGDLNGSHTSMTAHGDGISTTVAAEDYDMFVDMEGSFGNSSSSGVNITDGALTGNIDVLTDSSSILYDVMVGSDFAVAECLPAPCT